MRYVLSLFEYDGRDAQVVGVPDPRIVISAADILDEDHDAAPSDVGLDGDADEGEQEIDV
ncbi:hypothetical protein ABZ297_16160 [Nonomuraea sp. NPDC005983]|uniref:hypothetical protein n=1 Tax=Nonomuraea sp. NPDC005983 TaxID=3155595 RepID=UPI0033A4D16D